jgi:amino acid permease
LIISVQLLSRKQSDSSEEPKDRENEYSLNSTGNPVHLFTIVVGGGVGVGCSFGCGAVSVGCLLLLLLLLVVVVVVVVVLVLLVVLVAPIASEFTD